MQPVNFWSSPLTWCQQQVDRYNPFGTPPPAPEPIQPAGCTLKAELVGVNRAVDGTFSITLGVSGNLGPVSLSLDNERFTPGLTLSGVSGQAVVVYVLELPRRCRTALYVELTAGLCSAPAVPTLSILNNTCGGAAGRIGLLEGVGAGLVALWYPATDGTGISSEVAPAYRSDQPVVGSVRLARANQLWCQSPPVPFVTAPPVCGCTAVGLGGITSLGSAVAGRLFSRRIALSGAAPFSLGIVQKPLWLSVAIDGPELVLSGTPASTDRVSLATVKIEVTNCPGLNGTFGGRVLLNESLPVRLDCSSVVAKWVVLAIRCRSCVSVPDWRVSRIKCLPVAPCESPAKNVVSSLTRTSGNKGQLTLNYATASDQLTVRLLIAGQATAFWSSQTAGGARTLAVNYDFPLTTGQYTLTVERTGQAQCRAEETGLSLAAAVAAPQLVCGFGEVILMAQNGVGSPDDRRSFSIPVGMFSGANLRYELWDTASGLNLTIGDEGGFATGQIVLSNYRVLDGVPRENPYTLLLTQGMPPQLRGMQVRAINAGGFANYDFPLTVMALPVSPELKGISVRMEQTGQDSYTLDFTTLYPVTITLTAQQQCVGDLLGHSGLSLPSDGGGNALSIPNLKKGAYMARITASTGAGLSVSMILPLVGQVILSPLNGGTPPVVETPVPVFGTHYEFVDSVVVPLDPEVVSVDGWWQRLVSGSDASNRVFLRMSLANGTGATVRVGWTIAGESTPRQNLSAQAVTGDPNGHQFGFDLNFTPGSVITLFVAPQKNGITYPEVSFFYTVPTGVTTPRAELYPLSA